MPYRELQPVELCSFCSAGGVGTCLRCGAGVCAEHQPADDARCARCEAWFAEREERQKKQWAFQPFSRTAAIIMLFTPAWMFGVGSLVKTSAIRRRRREFLLERR